MNISNQSTIEEWSNFSDEDLIKFGASGDDARKNLLDHHVIRLLEPIEGMQILDAGCGNGYMSRKLSALGARVTGVEPATNLYNYCTQKEKTRPDEISYIQQDLTKLDIHTKFDGVVLINVLMDIPDYLLALQNSIDVLRPNGILVFSILHPAFPGFAKEWQDKNIIATDEYFNVPPLKQKYGHLHTRPIQDYINNTIKLGCNIEEIVEPQSADEAQDSRNYHVPQFFIVKARKR